MAQGPSFPKKTIRSSATTIRSEVLAEVPNLLIDIPPKYAAHIGTNYIPSPAEIRELQTFSSQLTSKANEIHDEITKLEEQLGKLKSRHALLKKAAAPYASLASPFRRFPPELMQCIFVCCLPESRNAVMHCTEAPVLLGRVCSDWRRIVLNTPELWSTLHIVPPNYSPDSYDLNELRFHRKRQVVEQWLGRAGACPLSVSFVWFGGEGDSEVRLCGTLLRVLLPLSRRWRQLDFQVPLRMFKPFLGLKTEDVPLLEGLTLTDNRSNFETDVVWPESLAFAANARRLRRLNLTFFSGGIQLPTIVWEQLTTLYLESNVSFFFRDCEDMTKVLGECASLQSCTLKFPLSHSMNQPDYKVYNHVVTLPKLRFLCIDGDQNLFNSFHMTTTLSNLKVPSLRTLEIYGRTGRPDGAEAPEPLVGIQKLLKQSRCPLEKLKLESVALLENEFVECLSLAPTLEELVVRDYGTRIGFLNKDEKASGVEDGILKALTLCPPGASIAQEEEEEGSSDAATSGEVAAEQPQPEYLCPALTVFDFALSEASQELFCDFVESRWIDVPEGLKQLKKVKCSFTAREEKESRERVSALQEDGLDATVVFHLPLPDDISPSPWTGVEGL